MGEEKETQQLAHMLTQSILEERNRAEKATATNKKIEKAQLYKFNVAKREMKERQNKLKARLAKVNAGKVAARERVEKKLKKKAAEKRRREEAAAVVRAAKAIELREQEAKMRDRQIKKQRDIEAKLLKQREE